MEDQGREVAAADLERVTPAAVCDGGDLDCGSGLLLIIRKAMLPLAPGDILEVRSREPSVREDLPAWCRMVEHQFLGSLPSPRHQRERRYFIRKGEPAAPEEERPLDADLEAARGYTWAVRVRGGEGPRGDGLRIYNRNHALAAGPPVDFGEKVEALGSVDYLLAAIGACVVGGFQAHAARAGVIVDAIELTLKGKLGNVLVHLGLEERGTPGLVRVWGTLYVSSPDEPERLREIWETTLKRSPVLRSLSPGVEVDLELSIFD